MSVQSKQGSRRYPDFGALSPPASKSCYWIFQFSPNIYRWFDRRNDTKDTNKSEQWIASRYSEYMKIGDYVAIWASGKKAGIYALGQLVTYATDMPLGVEDEKYWRDDLAANKFLYHKSVMVQYFKDISACPLLKEECL